MELVKRKSSHCDTVLDENTDIYKQRRYNSSQNSEQFQNLKNQIDEQSMVSIGTHSQTSNSEDQSFQIEICQNLSEICRACDRFQTMNKEQYQKIQKHVDDFNFEFESYAKKIIKNAFNIFEETKGPQQISEQNIEMGSRSISCLQEFRSSFKKYKLNKLETILNNHMNALQQKLEGIMDKYIEFIQQFLNEQDKAQQLDNLKRMYDNLKLLKELPLLQTHKIESRFYQLENSISTFVRIQDDQIGKIFEQIQDRSKRNFKHLRNLRNALKALNQLSWFQSYNQQSFKNALKNIEDRFTEYIDQLKKEVTSIRYGLNDIENIKKLANAQTEINEYKEIISIVNKDINLQDEIKFKDKLKIIHSIVQIHEEKIADFEKQEHPLEVYQLKMLEDFRNYLEILQEKSEIFGSEIDYIKIQYRIDGDEKSLISKQYNMLIIFIKKFAENIDSYCKDSKEIIKEVSQNEIDQLYTILQTIKELKTKNPIIYEKIDKLSMLIPTVNFQIDWILQSFRDLQIKIEQQNAYNFIKSYDILGKITFIDQFTEKQEFKEQFTIWKNMMVGNPTENQESLKQMFQINNFSGVNNKARQIKAMNNMNEFNNILCFIQNEVQRYKQALSENIKLGEVNIESIEKIRESVIILNKIQSNIDKEYLIQSDIQKYIYQVFTRLKKQADGLLEKSKNQRSLKKYYQSYEYIKSSTIIRDFFVDYFRKELIQDEEQKTSLQKTDSKEENLALRLEESIKLEFINFRNNLIEYIAEYQTMDFELYESNMPIEIDSDLRKIYEDDNSFQYNEILKKNVLKQLEKYIEIMENLLDDENTQTIEVNQRLQKVHKVKDQIPNQWWAELQKKIDNIKQNVEQKLEEEKDILCSIEKNNDIGQFIQQVEKNPKLIKIKEQVAWLKNCFQQQIKICYQNLTPNQQLSIGIKGFIEIHIYLSNKYIFKTLVKNFEVDLNNIASIIIELIGQNADQFQALFENQNQQHHNLNINMNPQFQQQAQFQQQNNDKQIEGFLYVIQAFRNLERSNQIKECSQFKNFQKVLSQKLDEINQFATKFIQNLQKNLDQAIDVQKLFINGAECNQNLIQMIRVQRIIFKIREFQVIQWITLGQSQEIQNCTKYLIQTPIEKIQNILQIINQNFSEIELITEKTKQSGKDKKDHYCNILNMINTIAAVQVFGQEIRCNFADLKLSTPEECKQIMNIKIQELVKQTQQLSRNVGENNKTQIVNFQEKYSHLISIQENLTMFRQQIKQNIEEIDDSIINKLNQICEQSERDIFDKNKYCDGLIRLQRANENYPNFRDVIKLKINHLIQIYKENTNSDYKQLQLLAMKLKDSAEGANLVSEFKQFEGVERALWNQKVQRIGIEQVLLEIEGDFIDQIGKDVLKSRYERFEKKYKSIVEQHLKNTLNNKEIDFSTIIGNIVGQSNRQQRKWTQENKENLPDLLASIFALWTLSSVEHYLGAENDNIKTRNTYLRMPHAAQVLSIFRIMGVGYKQFNENPDHKINLIRKIWQYCFRTEEKQKPVIADNLVQIKTGEGKSITLAVVSIVFALFGFEVRVACYSEYLSKRDYEAFIELFKVLDVQDNIKYGTFNQACEAYINKDGNIRDVYLSKILKGSQQIKKKIGNEKPRVLLIDEVDVFFSKEFYGAIYRPQATIQNSYIAQLIDYIWQSKSSVSSLQLSSIKENDIYKKCLDLFNPIYAPLLDEAVKDMICDVQDYHLHDYIEQNGMIGYKDQDQISYDLSYGYKTTFAYYQKHSEGRITDETLAKQKGIGINLGEFSFSEIPKNYAMILGVTGTLKQLTESEKSIIKNVYNIINFTYSPSVYGKSQLKWDKTQNIIIAKKELYFIEIVNEITRKMHSFTRAVIVFFKNDKNLQLFLSSKEFKDAAYQSYQILNERLTFQEKEDRIKMASRSGQITLATSSFGRGADFICKDQIVEKEGGVHVLLTFFSHEASEEVQLIGRTARQGDQGSVSMVLLEYDLLEFDIDEKDIVKYGQSSYYKMLEEHRSKLQSTNQINETTSLATKIEGHELASEMCKLALNQGNDNKLFEFLKQINLGRTKGKVSKTLIMMDATGSMSSFLTLTKNAVSTMIADASKILIEKNYDPKLFEIKFGCYRNYSSKRDKLLQCSSWESNPQVLTKFMETVDSSGGQGNEAVEIGLWQANQEPVSENGGLSQVFIIGDMPPNTLQEVKDKRKGAGENWNETNFREETFYEWELKKLKAKGIQVFTFYVKDEPETKEVFKKISDATGATSQFLDVSSSNGSKMLEMLFVTEILRKVGEMSGAGKGEMLVQAYKAYKQSSA